MRIKLTTIGKTLSVAILPTRGEENPAVVSESGLGPCHLSEGNMPYLPGTSLRGWTGSGKSSGSALAEGAMELRVFSDLKSFLAHQELWDDLWHRSRSVLPTARADLIGHWVQHFALGSRFCVLVVAEADRWLAGFPLVQRRIKGGLPAADLPANPWTANGELLVDESTNVGEVLRCLCQGLSQTQWPLLWIDMVPAQAARWQCLLAELQTLRLPFLLHWRYPVGVVRFEGDFSAYWASRSSHLQKKVRKGLRQLEKLGKVEIRILQEATPLQWAGALERAWRIEDASWKGQAGTSVLQTPGMADFYHKQTQILAGWHSARLAFLEVAGRAVAFLYGWEAKNVVQVLKIGYDPEFARFSPGHLLWYLWLQNLANQNPSVTVDFLGPLTEGTRPWATEKYPIGRIIVAITTWGKWIMAGYQLYRWLKTKRNQESWPDECSAATPEAWCSEPADTLVE